MTKDVSSTSLLSTFWLGLVLLLLACGSSRVNPSPNTAGPQITITGASINASNRVVVNYTVTQNGQAAEARQHLEAARRLETSAPREP